MKTKSHSISGAFVFMLLGVFAVFSMLLVVLGAQAYRTTVDGAAAHTQKRIVTAFVRNAVRAQDERGAITVEEHDGLPVLALSSELDGERYVQYIYSYGGSLCELFTSARYGFSPEDGEAGWQLLEAAAKKRGFLAGRGEYDTERMSAVLLDEFRGGKLGRMSLEAPDEG